jgi:hypothetical protein
MTSTNGHVVDKHILINFKDTTTGNTVDYVAYVSDWNDYLPLSGETLSGPMTVNGITAAKSNMIMSGTVIIQQTVTLNGNLIAENPPTFNNGLTVLECGFDLSTCSRYGVVFQFPVSFQQSLTNGSSDARADSTINDNLTLSGELTPDSLKLIQGSLTLSDRYASENVMITGATFDSSSIEASASESEYTLVTILALVSWTNFQFAPISDDSNTIRHKMNIQDPHQDKLNVFVDLQRSKLMFTLIQLD